MFFLTRNEATDRTIIVVVRDEFGIRGQNPLHSPDLLRFGTADSVSLVILPEIFLRMGMTMSSRMTGEINKFISMAIRGRMKTTYSVGQAGGLRMR